MRYQAVTGRKWRWCYGVYATHRCERLQAYRREWLIKGSTSPKILRQLAYGKAIIKEGTAPAVYWFNGEMLWYEGRATTMTALRQCIRALIDSTTAQLNELMFGDENEVLAYRIH